MDKLSVNIHMLLKMFLISQLVLAFIHLSEAIVVLNLTEPNNATDHRRGLTFLYHATCKHDGSVYPVGQFSPSACVSCNCDGTSGDVTCLTKNCPTIRNCIHYTNIKDNCCPICLEHGCYYNESLYAAGANIQLDTPCMKCYCPWDAAPSGGDVTCVTIQCERPRCVDAVTPQGKCCPTCPNGPNCYLDDVIISEGEHVYVDNCRDCHCSPDDYIAKNEPRHATCTRSFFCL